VTQKQKQLLLSAQRSALAWHEAWYAAQEDSTKGRRQVDRVWAQACRAEGFLNGVRKALGMARVGVYRRHGRSRMVLD